MCFYLADVCNKSCIQCDIKVKRINDKMAEEEVFKKIGDMLYEYTAESVYNMKLLSINEVDNMVNVTILIGDFYFGGMYSSNSIITIEL